MAPDAFPSIWLILVAFPVVALAYMIFAMAGFGAVFITAPALAQVMPVSHVVPVLSLVDFGAAAITGAKLGRKIAFDELKFLIPLMLIGSALGIYLLLVIPPRPMMFGLGVFVFCYAIYALFVKLPTTQIPRGWVFPIGLLGGVFSGMFGSGGFIYVIYLTRRLEDKDAIRATQSMLITLSTATRAVIFLIAGVYANLQIVFLAIACVPAMLLGTWLGHHVTLRMSREAFLRTIYSVLVVAGISLLVRAWFMN
jgi:uncharacterized membrane protein YfcA